MGEDPETAIEHPEEQRGSEHDVRELFGLQRRLTPLEHLLHALPVAQVAERTLGRAEHASDRGDPLVAGHALRVACASHVRREPLLQPVAAARREKHEECEEHEEPCREPDDDAARRPVDECRQQARRRGRSADVPRLRRDDERERGRSRTGHSGLDLEMVARPRGGDVGNRPRVAQPLGDRAVDAGECRGRRGAVVVAARLARELLERARVETLALDADRIDRYARFARDRDRIRERGLAGDVLSVGQDDQHPADERARAQLSCSRDDRVVECGSLAAGDGDVSQRGVGIDCRGRQGAQRNRVGTEGEHRNCVCGRLRGDEASRRRHRSLERRSDHRSRVVDREHDRLRVAEVLGDQAGDGLAVLGHARSDSGSERRHDRSAHGREAAGVDRRDGDSSRGRRRDNERGDDNGEGPGEAAHLTPPNFGVSCVSRMA